MIILRGMIECISNVLKIHLIDGSEFISRKKINTRTFSSISVKVTHFSMFQREGESNDKLFPFGHQERVWFYEKIMGLDDNT